MLCISRSSSIKVNNISSSIKIKGSLINKGRLSLTKSKSNRNSKIILDMNPKVSHISNQTENAIRKRKKFKITLKNRKWTLKL
jgi:Na+/phosphate symporter